MVIKAAVRKASFFHDVGNADAIEAMLAKKARRRDHNLVAIGEALFFSNAHFLSITCGDGLINDDDHN